jgi:hypothetical protein
MSVLHFGLFLQGHAAPPCFLFFPSDMRKMTTVSKYMKTKLAAILPAGETG